MLPMERYIFGIGCEDTEWTAVRTEKKVQGQNIFRQTVATTKLYTAKTIKFRKFDLKMEVKTIGNRTCTLLHKFLCLCAHICQNVFVYVQWYFEIAAKLHNFKLLTLKLEVHKICEFAEVRQRIAPCRYKWCQTVHYIDTNDAKRYIMSI